MQVRRSSLSNLSAVDIVDTRKLEKKNLTMIEKLTKELKDKIASFDICKPYVWLLKLSEADFNELEICLKDIASANGFSALASPQFGKLPKLAY